MSGMYIEIFLRFFFNTENVQNVYRDRFKVFFNAENVRNLYRNFLIQKMSEICTNP
jgi:hypothetical protein